MPTNHRARPAAADQFAALGLTPDEWTKAMRVAVTQKWTALPVDDKVADLRERVADVVQPDAATIAARHPDASQDPAEAARLLRNARVDAWRTRTRLQAALDARELRFAKMRAARKGAAA